MHPPLTARPRPPARRTTSKSTLTALPTPSTPRRRRSQLDSSTTDGTHTGGDDDSWGRASGQRASLGSSSSSAQPRPAPAARPPLASSSRRGASGRSTLDELDTPPSSTPIAPEPSHAATSSRNKPSVLPVPFPSADDDPFAPAPSSSSPAAAQHDLAHGDSAGLGIDDGDTTINIDALRGLSREELAHMLQEADRIIRDKEQELSTFTAAGEELLNEFDSLRQRHESLAGRTSATPVRASPQRSSRNSTISAATSSPVADGKRRAHSSWRVSLGLPPPSGTLGEDPYSMAPWHALVDYFGSPRLRGPQHGRHGGAYCN